MRQLEDFFVFKHNARNIADVFANYKSDDRVRKFAIEAAERCSKEPIKMPTNFYVSLIYFLADEFNNKDDGELIGLYFVNKSSAKLIMEMIIENFEEKTGDEKH